MGRPSDMTMCKISKAIREQLPDNFGFVVLAVDLDDGLITVASDAPDKDVVASVMAYAAQQTERAHDYVIPYDGGELN